MTVQISQKGCFSTHNYEQNILIWLHISHTHAWLLQHLWKWKRLYLRRKRVNILIEAGDNIRCLAQFSVHLFSLSTTTLSALNNSPFSRRQQQHHQFGTEESHVFCPCLSNLCCPKRAKSHTKAIAQSPPHRDIIPRILPTWDLWAEKALKTPRNSLNLNPHFAGNP